MSEQRLINSNADVYKYVETWTCNCSEYGVQNVMAVDDISTLPEIDPETLPIVQRLKNDVDGFRQNWYKACEMVKQQRTELKRVTAERDIYKIFFEDITKCGDCNDCGKSKTCEFVPKVGQTTRYNCPLWTGR